jgi:metallophosphoesterase (TIGR00282 family)
MIGRRVGGVRVLFLGDIVGEPGRKIVRRAVPVLREERAIDLVVANAENVAGGSGMTPKIYAQLRRSGVDACTMGDHIYKKREIIPLLVKDEPVCKPANFPAEAPGRDHVIVETKGGDRVGIISVLGRIFMRPVDCPLAALDRVIDELAPQVKIILVDVHAEATSEKQVIFRYVAGRVSAVVGTHTHVPTADATVASQGTAFISDLGMTGPYESIIGRRIDKVIKTTKTFEPFPFDVATGDPRLSGAIIDIDESNGKARSIEPIHLDKAAVDAIAGPGPADA